MAANARNSRSKVAEFNPKLMAALVRLVNAGDEGYWKTTTIGDADFVAGNVAARLTPRRATRLIVEPEAIMLASHGRTGVGFGRVPAAVGTDMAPFDMPVDLKQLSYAIGDMLDYDLVHLDRIPRKIGTKGIHDFDAYISSEARAGQFNLSELPKWRPDPPWPAAAVADMRAKLPRGPLSVPTHHLTTMLGKMGGYGNSNTLEIGCFDDKLVLKTPAQRLEQWIENPVPFRARTVLWTLYSYVLRWPFDTIELSSHQDLLMLQLQQLGFTVLLF